MDVSQAAGAGRAAERAPAAAGIVLLGRSASAQFLMTLDSSVMNVSIATVAKDVGTTVTGIQTAITFYTLVMASLMITGGKVGQILGRKRAFAIGCVIYGCGSLTTALAGNLAVLMVGWSVLEGVGAALDHAGRSSRWSRRTSPVTSARAHTGWSASAWRDRGGGRAADRRPFYNLCLLAVGVRR